LVCNVVAAAERAKAAEEAVKRARPRDKIVAEIKAHRAAVEATELASAVSDRIAQQATRKASAEPPPCETRRSDIEAVVERAMARQRRGAS
jgi:hypothetical protein